MKELRVDLYEYNYNVISFTNNIFSFVRLFFLIEKNFKRKTEESALSKRYLDLNSILNLKQFKIEISEIRYN